MRALVILLGLICSTVYAGEDFASLQRGAKTFINNCQSCHSLKFVRYNRLAEQIGITDESGKVLSEVVKTSLMLIGDNPNGPMLTSMPMEDGVAWFGKAPPDLSLVTRSKGSKWLYDYMHSFYKDPSKPWGVNNLTFPDVGMPHVLVNLQGVQEPIYDKDKNIMGLRLAVPGKLSVTEYNNLVRDLVNFLSYVGEPVKLERKRIGVFVLVFLGILLIFTYLLKREFWKDIH